MEFSPEPGRNDRKAASYPVWELRQASVSAHYLWRGRGYLLPGTSIMGQVMKEGLEDNNNKEKGKITTLPEVGMKLTHTKTVNVQVQPRLCSPGRGTRWPVSFLQVCEVPAATVGQRVKKIKREK